MVQFSKIKPIARIQNLRGVPISNPSNVLGENDLRLLGFLYLLDEGGYLPVDREIVKAAYPDPAGEVFDRLVMAGLYEGEPGGNRFVRGPARVDQFPDSCNFYDPVNCRNLHAIAAKYYEELQKKNDTIDLAAERYFHSFLATDENGYFLGSVDISGYTEGRDDDASSFLVQPGIVRVNIPIKDSERAFLIALARILVRYSSLSYKRVTSLLEACRILHKLAREKPDELLFEFIGATDSLYTSLYLYEDDRIIPEPAERRYTQILAFLDLISDRSPEITEYCRFPVYLRLAEIHENSGDTEQMYWIEKAVVDFGGFVRKYGPGYLSDYLSLIREVSPNLRRAAKMGRVWSSLLEMEEWGRNIARENNYGFEKQYAEILMQFSSMILEIIKFESAIFIGNLSEPAGYQAAINLAEKQEQWSREAAAIYRRLSKDDENLSIVLAEALELHAFGLQMRTALPRHIPRTFWKSILNRTGMKKPNERTVISIREHEEAAAIFWSAARKKSLEPNFSRKEYLALMEKYLEAIYRMGWLFTDAMDFESEIENVKIRIAVTRYLWKVEHFSPPIRGLLSDYAINVEKLKKLYGNTGNRKCVEMCDEELYFIKHPFEDAFGERYRDPALVSVLTAEASRSGGRIFCSGENYFRKFEVSPGKNVIVLLWGENGPVRAVFPDRFLHRERIDCSDVDISPLVTAMGNYR